MRKHKGSVEGAAEAAAVAAVKEAIPKAIQAVARELATAIEAAVILAVQEDIKRAIQKAVSDATGVAAAPQVSFGAPAVPQVHRVDTATMPEVVQRVQRQPRNELERMLQGAIVPMKASDFR